MARALECFKNAPGDTNLAKCPVKGFCFCQIRRLPWERVSSNLPGSKEDGAVQWMRFLCDAKWSLCSIRSQTEQTNVLLRLFPFILELARFYFELVAFLEILQKKFLFKILFLTR